MGVQTLEDDYERDGIVVTMRRRSKQQSTVNIQNTEDNLKILLRLLSIKYLHN